MSLENHLAAGIASGIRRIGQVAILSADGAPPYRLCHCADLDAAGTGGIDGLELIDGPGRARELSTWSDEGEYRFLKAAPNLRRGWLLRLGDARELRQALDGFYPAAIGLWRALGRGTAEPQHLRDKLGRQSGMYRFARNISDAGALEVVRSACDPDRCCARRILWQLDEHTPLPDESGSDRAAGLGDGGSETDSIPLLCREPCNHLVAACRLVSKRESEASPGPSSAPSGSDSH